MRKIVFMFIALIAISQNVCAQGMTATLQSGDDFKAFYGIDAFKEAYEAAKDGDQITLSAGTFDYPSDALTKSVKITGVGAFEITSNTVIKNLNVSASNIRIEGVKISGTLNPSGSVNLIVVRCWLENLDASKNYTNPLFRECVIKKPSNFVYAKGFTIMNCTIETFSGDNNASLSNVGTVVNTVLYEWNSQSTKTAPHAIYRNCLIGYKGYSSMGFSFNIMDCYSPSEFYNNVMFNSGEGFSVVVSYSSDCIHDGNSTTDCISSDGAASFGFPYNDHFSNLPAGSDGTPVGIYGGIGFSEYPAIPRVVSKTIDGYTNDEGKIKVKVEVAAGQ